MLIKSILTTAAIAIAATCGSAYAADPFSTVAGIQAEALSAAEMDAVMGMAAIDVDIDARGNTRHTMVDPFAGPALVDVDVTVTTANPPVVTVSGNN